MPKEQPENDTLDLTCPCCGARLTVDAALGKVLAHEAPAKHSKAPDLDQVSQLLEKEKVRRDALFEKSAAEEKVKGQVLERKFEEALKKTKDQPVTRPTRDIDLD